MREKLPGFSSVTVPEPPFGSLFNLSTVSPPGTLPRRPTSAMAALVPAGALAPSLMRWNASARTSTSPYVVWFSLIIPPGPFVRALPALTTSGYSRPSGKPLSCACHSAVLVANRSNRDAKLPPRGCSRIALSYACTAIDLRGVDSDDSQAWRITSGPNWVSSHLFQTAVPYTFTLLRSFGSEPLKLVSGRSVSCTQPRRYWR